MTAIPAGQDVTGTRQLAAWRERVMPPVEQLAADLWSVPVPIPNNPLRYVSSYAFASGGGLVLLDTGWAAEESWQALVAGLGSIGASVEDVRGVLVSHMHLDHAGLAGRVRQASGAWVAMHPADRALLASADLGDPERAVSLELAFLRSLGASADEAAASVGSPAAYRLFTSITLPDRELSDGDLADVPGWRLRAVHTPGHTPGHLCFVDEAAAAAVRRRPYPAADHAQHLGSPGRGRPAARQLPRVPGQGARPGRGRDHARRTNGGSAAWRSGPTTSPPITSGGSASCWPRSPPTRTPPPGTWPAT